MDEKLLPCPFCKKPPGSKVGPPAMARCVTDGCEGKNLAASTLAEWNTRLAAQSAAPIPFYGAECPSYPACNGGCGLGCTHEIESAQSAAPVGLDADAMRKTAAELRAGGGCNAIEQAIMWERKAAEVESAALVGERVVYAEEDWPVLDQELAGWFNSLSVKPDDADWDRLMLILNSAAPVGAVAWRVAPDDTLFMQGTTITDDAAVAKHWVDVGCDVQPLGVLGGGAPNTPQVKEALEFYLLNGLDDGQRAQAAIAILDVKPGEQAGNWQLIETAPLDGARILLFQHGRGAFEGWWHDDWPHAEHYWMDDQDSEPAPTHWRPLLIPPALSPEVKNQDQSK